MWNCAIDAVHRSVDLCRLRGWAGTTAKCGSNRSSNRQGLSKGERISSVASSCWLQGVLKDAEDAVSDSPF